MMQLRKSMKTWSLILLTSLAVSGCWFTKTITETVYVEKQIPEIEMPKPLNLVVPHIYAVSHKNIDEFLDNNKTRNGTVVFIAMDVIDYEIFSHNLAETRRYIQQQDAVITYYRTQAHPEEIEQ